MPLLLLAGQAGPPPAPVSLAVADNAHRTATDSATTQIVSDYLVEAGNVTTLFPRPWAADSAFAPTGNLFAAASIFAVMLSKLDKANAYANQQKRIGTAVADNLENISNDFFGTGTFPRVSSVVGLSIVPETDALFAPRIKAAIVAPNNTLAAIQTAVTSYLQSGYAAQQASSAQVIGLDTAGGLDTRGGLDGRASTVPPVPSVTVFDIQSNPALSATIGLTAGQFCILFTYGGLVYTGMFLNFSKLNFAYILPDKLQVIAPLNSTLAGIVQSVKAQGMQPVYADNRA